MFYRLSGINYRVLAACPISVDMQGREGEHTPSEGVLLRVWGLGVIGFRQVTVQVMGGGGPQQIQPLTEPFAFADHRADVKVCFPIGTHNLSQSPAH